MRQLKLVQEEALLQFIHRKDVFCVLPTGCGKSLIFQLVPLVCAYLHNEKFNYPEKPMLLVICSLSALESHIQELANYGILSCNLGDGGHSILLFLPVLNSLFVRKGGENCCNRKSFKTTFLV